MPTYARADIAIERGEGAWAIAGNGERYLDFGAGVAVNSLGYSHPHLIAALTEQAQKIWHTSNLYQSPQGERLAARLCEATFADQVFFTNSGAEALECAIKMARKYQSSTGHPEKYRIITFEGAFHGRTLATIAAGGQAKYLEGFGPKVDGFDQVPFGDHAAVKAAITPQTAAILIEPIQGEGGVRVVPPQCLRGLRELCDEHGLLLIFDEVQSGVGRTGRLFAYQGTRIAPDIMAIAKGIGGGFPMGACLATKEAAQGMGAGTHGSTFGGNPLAMAVGNAVLDEVLKPEFLEHVNSVSLLLKQKLMGLLDHYPNIISEVRGEGLFLGLRAKVPASDLVTAARANHLLVIPAGDNVVRLIPPLIITADDVASAVQKLEAACNMLENARLTAQKGAAK
ncbi:MAG: aspartate aminotransferase family protein [Hyphomicrobiales bacterium]|nr:aspartate aminotransferase family protein [Hyphomicrobiales bacterium]MDE2115007.1 aspartate aminotransferase family protein [Hyphomicrobiales bacterium]